jgi:hypothetical protein
VQIESGHVESKRRGAMSAEKEERERVPEPIAFLVYFFR